MAQEEKAGAGGPKPGLEGPKASDFINVDPKDKPDPKPTPDPKDKPDPKN